MTESTRFTTTQRHLLGAVVQVLRTYERTALQMRVDRSGTHYARTVITIVQRALEGNASDSEAANALFTIASTKPSEQVSPSQRLVHRIVVCAAEIISQRDIDASYIVILNAVSEDLLQQLKQEFPDPDNLQKATASVPIEATSKDDFLRLPLYIDPGNATPSEIKDVLVALSDLHRAAGGSGLRFSVDHGRVVVGELV